MWNKICIILVVFLTIPVLLISCSKEISKTNSNEIAVENNSVAVVLENNQPQEGDIRTIDEIDLTNLSQDEQVKKYKVGDRFLGLTVTELEYEQIYSKKEWVDNYISIKFEGSTDIYGNIFIHNGNIQEIQFDENMSENIPIVPEHQFGSVDFPNPNYDEINNQILLLSDQKNFPSDIYNEDGIIKIPSTSKMHTLTVKYEQKNPLQVYVECEPISLSIRENITDDDFLHGEWRFLVTRELDFIELSNKDYSAQNTKVNANDYFMDFEINKISHVEFFADEKWYDGDLYIDLKGNQTLEGFIYEGMGTIFVYDSNFYSDLPAPTIQGEEPEITKTYFIIQDQDALVAVSKCLLEMPSLRYNDDLDKWDNISITFDSFSDGYSLNSTGSPHIDNILEIKNNKTGEVIYTAPAEVEHVE